MNSVLFEKLLKQFMYGNISKLEYRNQRTKLVQQLISNDKTVPKMQAITSEQNAKIIAHKPDFQIPTIKNEPKNYTKPEFKIAAIIVIIFIAFIIWYYINIKSTKLENSTADTNLPKVTKNITTPRDEPFIMAFNITTTWNTELISDFLVQWQSLTPKQQINARLTSSYLVLEKNLREKIQQQKTLRLKDNKPTRKENLLIWFAAQLSIGIN